MQNLIEIRNDTLRASVLPMGATLTGLWPKGAEKSLILGLVDPADYVRFPIYSGAIVGPLANRLRGGQARIDGQTVRMPRNEGGRTTLHSGPQGLHTHEWAVTAKSVDAVTLECTLADGACGLPGQRKITATYRLLDHRLQLNLTATTDAPTFINLAHHPYWMTGENARLQVNARHYLPVDDLNLPTGEILDVAGTEFDLRTPTRVPAHLDHNYVLANAARPAPDLAAELTTDTYGLQIRTSAPGLQVYSGSGLPDISAARTTSGAVQSLAGLALEPQLWPDAPNHSGFPSVLLRPGEIWKQLTDYCLIV